MFSPNQWYRSLLSIGRDNLQFYPKFALFSTLGGMNLDHDFVQVWKFSEDQKKANGTLFPQIQVKTKKKVFIKNIYLHQTLFPHIQVKTKQKKRSSSKIEHFFPQTQVKTKKRKKRSLTRIEHFFPIFTLRRTPIQIIGGCRCGPVSNYWGGYSQIIEGI